MALQLRTSLATISGYAQQLANNRDPELAKQLATDIAHEAAQLDRSIGGFLIDEAHRASGGSGSRKFSRLMNYKARRNRAARDRLIRKKVNMMKRIACSGMGLALILGLAGLPAGAQNQAPSSAPTSSSGSSLGEYARQIRKDPGATSKPKVFDNDNLPRRTSSRS